MAVRLVAPYRKCVRAYLPSLRAVVQRFQCFSSQDEPYPLIVDEPEISQVVWPERALGPLCTKDRRFPLPGNIGVLHEDEAIPPPLRVPPFHLEDALVTLPARPEERHLGVLVNYLAHNPHNQFSMQEFMPEDYPRASDMLECAAYDCPQILRKDFAGLFPDRNTLEGPFTVMTLSQHTVNDMTMWSVEVESEREALFETFMQGAMELCNILSKHGFWADFIDPLSGKPFKGPHTNATLFETDERYRKLGFQIDDLGCCKVIRHAVWGTHAFVGCLFTNAPVNHPLILQLSTREDAK